MSDHKPLHILVIGITVLLFLLMLILCCVYEAPGAGSYIYFQYYMTSNTADDVIAADITPPTWVFTFAWVVIYISSIGWIAYIVASIFRRSAVDRKLLYTVPLVPLKIHPFLWINFCVNFAWLVLIARPLAVASVMYLFLTCLSIYIPLAYSCLYLYEERYWFYQQQYCDFWYYRYILLNGMAFYAGWSTLDFWANFAQVITYYNHDQDFVSGIISLIFFAIQFIVWFILDNFVWEKYLRYVFAEYIALLLGLIGILTGPYMVTGEGNFVFVVILFFAILIAAAYRLYSIIFIGRKRESAEMLAGPISTTTKETQMSPYVNRTDGDNKSFVASQHKLDQPSKA